MKTDLNSLKKELGKLTNLNYLKKELNRITAEIKKFDMRISLTPQAKEKLDALETRFQELVKAVNDLQKQADREITKLVKIVRQTGIDAEKKLRSSMRGFGAAKKKAGVKKAAARKTTKKAATRRPARARTTAKSAK